MNMNYQDFLESKFIQDKNTGFDPDQPINPILFDFQQAIVKWALRRGRAAVFADTGLGKTFIQLEWAKHIIDRTGKPILILCPLAVSGQTIKEGRKLGIEVKRLNDNEIAEGVYITNYEQLKNIEPGRFVGVVLDESSILKNYTGVYKRMIIDKFKDTQYKMACTATPAPNDHMEIGNHSAFLNIMPSNEMLSRFFINDTMNIGTYRVKKHAENDFWLWVSSWAVMLSKPEDLNFTAPGFELPELKIEYINIKVDISDTENGNLFRFANVNATSFNGELRKTLKERMDKVAEIVNKSDESFIVWINQNSEADYIKKLIPDAVEVRGSELPAVKEKKLLGFADDEFRVLITKKKIAQFGLNYQNCHNQIFASLDFSFEGTYQAIRRCWRYGQRHPVNVKLLTTSTMANVKNILEKKQAEFNKMFSKSVQANIHKKH